MQGTRSCGLSLRFKYEQRNRNIKTVAIDSDKKETTVHRAVGSTQAAAAGVLKRLTWIQEGLMADHTQSLNVFGMSFCIGNDPMSGNQLRRDGACIGESNGVGELEEFLT